MTERPDIEPLDLHDRHVVKRIAQSSSSEKFIARHDIRSENGELLIQSGKSVDTAHLDRLLSAKLLEPIDSSLIHSGGVTVNSATLVGAAQQLIHNDPHTYCLFNATRNQLLPLDVLKRLEIPQQLAFKLHLLQETMPDMFSHSVSVALTAMYIGMKEELSSNELGQLATAGLFHDIGELHLDPDLVGHPDHRTPHQDYHNRVHPVLGYLLLKQFAKFQPGCSEVVLQHHERLDGSGYPRGLVGGEIGILGQILAISELVCSVYEKDSPEHAFVHLEAILNLNEPQYGHTHVEHLLSAYRQNDVTPSSVTQEDVVYVLDQLTIIGRIFRSWLELIDNQSQNQSRDQHEAIWYISNRLNRTINALHGMGYDPWHAKVDGSVAITNKKKIGEGIAVIHETYYQLLQVTNDYAYRWQERRKQTESDPVFKTLDNWIDTLHTICEQQLNKIP